MNGPAEGIELPVARIGRILVATLPADLDDTTAKSMTINLANRVSAESILGVAIDISGLDVVDSFVGRVLTELASIMAVIGAKMILVGMRPAVAISLVELGLPMHGMSSALSLECAMRQLSAKGGTDEQTRAVWVSHRRPERTA